jgi:hypothetical protein
VQASAAFLVRQNLRIKKPLRRNGSCDSIKTPVAFLLNAMVDSEDRPDAMSPRHVAMVRACVLRGKALAPHSLSTNPYV